MNVLIVDTSSWVSYFRGDSIKERDIDLALKEGRVYLPPIVIAELLSGNLTKNQHNLLCDMLADLPLCKSDFDHWTRVAKLRRLLAKKGITISVPDAHIAQCVLDSDCYLISEDKIFSKISKLVSLRIL